METGIADIIEIRAFSQVSTSKHEVLKVGKKSWIYCNEKIGQLEDLLWLYKRKKFSGKPLFIYEFVEQIEKIFFLDSYITLTLPSLFNIDPFSTGTELDDWEAEHNKIIGTFLKECDQTLLEAWGKAKFSEMLAPTGIPLEVWLKAAKE